MALKSGERKALKYAGLLILASVVLALLLIGGLVYRNSSTANEKFIRFLYPSFYLKVEDQNGQPVRFANVSYTNGRNYWLGSNSSFARMTTDSDGLARFYLDGRQFDIQEILSDGYHIDFRPQLALVSDEPAQRLYPSSLEQFGKASPLVIKAWKLGEIADSYRGAGRLSLINDEAVELSLLQDHNADCLDDLPFPCRRKLASASKPEAGLILNQAQQGRRPVGLSQVSRLVTLDPRAVRRDRGGGGSLPVRGAG